MVIAVRAHCNPLDIYIYIYIYITGKACNQAFHEILENFSHFLK